MDGATIATIISIIGCVIAVATFVTNIVSRAKNEGRIYEKIDQCCKSNEEIKNDIKEIRADLKQNDRDMNNRDKAISELEARMKSAEEDIRCIYERLNNYEKRHE